MTRRLLCLTLSTGAAICLLVATTARAGQFALLHDDVLGTSLEVLVEADDTTAAASAERAVLDEIERYKIFLSGLPPEAAHKYPSELSGGMRKRAGLARALAMDPELLFLDEPTSGLDPIGAANFDNLTRDLKETLGLTVFLITHDLDTLYAICDRVAVLADQKVIAIGAIEELLAIDHPWINAYFSGPRGRAARRGHSDQNDKVRAEMQQRGRS
jgi:phospholipid/cholesterol/gamma-HCH transport system ATP-binding protein